MMLCAV